MSIPRLQLRHDLIMRRIALRDRCVWVLKDPLSTTLHFFDDAEFAILRWLRDGDTFAALAARYRDRLPPSVLANFLSAATRAGILITPDETSLSPAWRPATARRRKTWWRNPLAIRLPGITPDQLGLFHWKPSRLRGSLRVDSEDKYKGVSPDVMRRAAMLFVAAISCLAVVIIGLHRQAFMNDFAAASSRLIVPLRTTTGAVVSTSLGSTLLVFAMAIAVTKIFHELAHAWVCHRLGGRCREIGILLLFGVPCLYCDVTDTWLMPRRRDRILVSAAGLIAEWIVAAVAVIVWVSTRPGMLHDVSALIVVVASVSTLMVNANPLLRYDGYYILSDAAGVPNLATEANLAMRQTWSNWMARIGGRERCASPQAWLVMYGIASNVYRLFILSVIGWAAFSLLKNSIGYGAALPITIIVASVVFRQRLGTWLASDRSTDASLSNRWRSAGLTGAILIGIASVVLIPLPHSLRVGGLIRPLHERPIFNANAGLLLSRSSASEVRLDDWRLQLKELVSRGRVQELESELAASRIDRIHRPELSPIQPILESQILSEQKNHATLAARMELLTISIDEDEILYEPPPRRVSRQDRIAGRWGWTGTPLTPGNVGATLVQGTLLGRAGSPGCRVASLYVPEQSVDDVRIGQSVAFGYTGVPIGSIRGHVASISADPIDEAPEEILAAGWIGAQPTERTGTAPAAVHYEVIVRLDDIDAGVMLPARLVTAARIHFPATSLASRWRKWFWQ